MEEIERGNWGITEGFLVGFASLPRSLPSQCSDNTNSKCVAAFPPSPAASAIYSSPIPPIPCGQFHFFLSCTRLSPSLVVSPPLPSPETMASPSAVRCGSTTTATQTASSPPSPPSSAASTSGSSPIRKSPPTTRAPTSPAPPSPPPPSRTSSPFATPSSTGNSSGAPDSSSS